MRKILIFLKIMQVVSNEKRHKNGLKRLGKGYFNAYRINPFNPLSYIAVLLILVVGILLFGIYGFWSQTDIRNPFCWY